MKNVLRNLFGSTDEKIVYNVLKTRSGWQVQAFLPKRISADDRIVVIDWFHCYRSEVQRQHPLWLTSFSATDQVYLLDIMQASSPKDLIAQATTLATNTDPRQLKLDYAW